VQAVPPSFFPLFPPPGERQGSRDDDLAFFLFLALSGWRKPPPFPSREERHPFGDDLSSPSDIGTEGMKFFQFVFPSFFLSPTLIGPPGAARIIITAASFSSFFRFLSYGLWRNGCPSSSCRRRPPSLLPFLSFCRRNGVFPPPSTDGGHIKFTSPFGEGNLVSPLSCLR